MWRYARCVGSLSMFIENRRVTSSPPMPKPSTWLWLRVWPCHVVATCQRVTPFAGSRLTLSIRANSSSVLPARYHSDKATEAKPGLECVGAGERRAQQNQEAVDEAVVLDEIARHHRIGDGSDEQLFDEAMPHGIRPARLARGAQGFGEAF